MIKTLPVWMLVMPFMIKHTAQFLTDAGLKYFVVGASSGAMGGSKSEEFMVKSSAGEDTVAYCEKCGYAATLKLLNPLQMGQSATRRANLFMKFHPECSNQLMNFAFLKIDENETAKSRIYIHDGQPVPCFNAWQR